MIDIISSAASRQSSIDRSARQRSQKVVMAIRSFLDGPAHEHRSCQRMTLRRKRLTSRQASSGRERRAVTGPVERATSAT
jgi:hypothetical protein